MDMFSCITWQICNGKSNKSKVFLHNYQQDKHSVVDLKPQLYIKFFKTVYFDSENMT